MNGRDTDPLTPWVPLALGGRTRRLRLDFNALVELEDRGVSVLSGLSSGKLTAREMRAVIWAACRADDPAVTEEEIGAWITARDFGPVMDAFAELWRVSMPEPEGGPSEPRPLAIGPPGPTG